MATWLQWIVLTTALLRGPGGAVIPPESVVPAHGVRDAVFAYLIGLVDGDYYGTIDGRTLEGVVARSSGASRLPYRHLDQMSRLHEEGRQTAAVRVAFRENLKIPIPYRILGYAPGNLRSVREVSFREWTLGNMSVKHQDEHTSVQVDLSDVHLYGVRSGWLMVDVHGWLDSLAGGKLDDTLVTGLVLFRYQGELWGLAVGYNRDWKGRSGLLNFRDNDIHYPSPAPLKTAAWKLRQILEGLEPSLRPDSLRVHGFR